MATGSGKGGGVRLKKRTAAQRRNRNTMRMDRKLSGRINAGGTRMTSSGGDVPF